MTPRPRRPDRAVYVGKVTISFGFYSISRKLWIVLLHYLFLLVPRARRSQTTPPPAAFAKSSPSANNGISESILSPATETNGWCGSSRTAAVISCDTEFSSSGRPNSDLVSLSFCSNQNHTQATAETSLNCDFKTNYQTNCDQSDVATTAGIRFDRLSAVNGCSETSVITLPFAVTQVNSTRMYSARNTTRTQNGTLRIEDAVQQPFDNRYGNSKDDKDEKELQRASKVSFYGGVLILTNFTIRLISPLFTRFRRGFRYYLNYVLIIFKWFVCSYLHAIYKYRLTLNTWWIRFVSLEFACFVFNFLLLSIC